MKWALVLLLLLGVTGAHALGISYEYLENNTLSLAPGQNYYFKLTIQNDAPEDVDVAVDVRSDVASLVGDHVLTIPAQTFDHFVYFNITLPSNALPGELFSVDYSVVPTERGEGQVPFSVRYERTLHILTNDRADTVAHSAPADIENVERTRQPIALVVTMALVILSLLFAVVYLWRRNKK